MGIFKVTDHFSGKGCKKIPKSMRICIGILIRHLAKYNGCYDEVYAIHGSIPVKPDIVDKLIEGAGQIRSGEAEGMKVNIFGNDVMLYKFPYAGFLYGR